MPLVVFKNGRVDTIGYIKSKGMFYARQQESQATDTGQILRRQKRTQLDKGEDGAAWYREYERLPSENGDRRICSKTGFA